MRRVVTRGALVLGGLILGLILSELLVRVSGMAPSPVLIRSERFQLSPNMLLGWEPLPGYWSWDGKQLDPKEATVHRDHLGFRTPEIPHKKPPGTHRIVVIGDSIAEGAQVADDELVFARQIETRLRRAGVKVDVVNLGVVAYTSLQEVEMLKKRGLAYKPDLVLVSYCLNDIDGYYSPIINMLAKEAAGLPDNSMLTDEHVTSLLFESELFRFLRYRALRPAPMPLRTLKWEQYPPGNSVPRAFDELARLSQEHGFSVMVVVFPLFAYEDPLFEAYKRIPDHEAVRNLAESHGFMVVDLLHAFRDCNERAGKVLSADVFHPTTEGHTCATDAIMPELGKRVSWAAPVLSQPGSQGVADVPVDKGR